MKEKAKQELISMLESHKGELCQELNNNKYLMARMVENQTIQKRKIVELNKIIHGLKI